MNSISARSNAANIVKVKKEWSYYFNFFFIIRISGLLSDDKVVFRRTLQKSSLPKWKETCRSSAYAEKVQNKTLEAAWRGLWSLLPQVNRKKPARPAKSVNTALVPQDCDLKREFYGFYRAVKSMISDSYKVHLWSLQERWCTATIMIC